jgi:hypothetical protein
MPELSMERLKVGAIAPRRYFPKAEKPHQKLMDELLDVCLEVHEE